MQILGSNVCSQTLYKGHNVEMIDNCEIQLRNNYKVQNKSVIVYRAPARSTLYIAEFSQTKR